MLSYPHMSKKSFIGLILIFIAFLLLGWAMNRSTRPPSNTVPIQEVPAPQGMSLEIKTWNWVETLKSDDTVIKPRAEKPFTLTFKKDKTFSATTDCNGVGGDYTVTSEKLAFNNLVSTMMYCEGSQEGEFTKMLTETEGYHFTAMKELVLDLKADGGSVVLK